MKEFEPFASPIRCSVSSTMASGAVHKLQQRRPMVGPCPCCLQWGTFMQSWLRPSILHIDGLDVQTQLLMKPGNLPSVILGS
jgi:hypothetical protein